MVRKAGVAGSFYPEEREILSEVVRQLLSQSVVKKLPPKGRLKALIVPHAGYVYSGIVAAAGFRLVKSAQVKQVILLGPTHQLFFEGVSVSLADYWETPLGKVRVDSLAKKLVAKQSIFCDIPQAHENEHCLEVELPFLQMVINNFSIIPLVCGQVKRAIFANALKPYFSEKTLMVVSSDLSHYYSYQKAIELDKVANEAIPALDMGRVEKEVEACGKTAILSVMEMAKDLGWKGMLIDYKNSGDTAGDKSSVVGYGCYAFYQKGGS